MQNIRILIVEDDPFYAVELEKTVEELGYEIAGSLDNSDAVLAFWETSSADLVLMDISIKGHLNGIELSERLQRYQVPIIFLTVFEDIQTYLSARQVSSMGYAVKPVHKRTLQHMIENALLNHASSKVSTKVIQRWQEENEQYNHLFLKNQNRLVRIYIPDIQLVKAEGNYCIIYMQERKFAVKLSLKQVKRKLPAWSFIQIHRNFLVQISKIDHIDLTNAEVNTGENSLPIGIKYKAELLERLSKLE